jgi:hypothetical protein
VPKSTVLSGISQARTDRCVPLHTALCRPDCRQSCRQLPSNYQPSFAPCSLLALIGETSSRSSSTRTYDVRLPDLRHSCATVLSVKGVSTQFVQVLLGHADIKLTTCHVVWDQAFYRPPSVGQRESSSGCSRPERRAYKLLTTHLLGSSRISQRLRRSHHRTSRVRGELASWQGSSGNPATDTDVVGHGRCATTYGAGSGESSTVVYGGTDGTAA